MRLFDLSGKVAVVTGGNRGIGLGLARGLSAAGATIAIAARDRAAGDKAAQELGNAAFLPVDLGEEASCRALVSAAVGRFGRIDILVNNGGINIAKPPQDLTLAEWRKVMDVNLTAAFILSQAVYPEFKRVGGGKIINVASMATRFGSGMAIAYGASKGALGQMTLGFASAWGKDNIQVNAIMPGYINTDLTAAARATPGFEQRVLARSPLARFGETSDCEGVAVFLASRASDFITGALIPVDGGYTAQL